MAKILAVSQDFNNKHAMSWENILEAIEVFQQFDNKRAVGICHHNWGCLTASRNCTDFKSALEHVNKAIEI